MEMSVLNRSVDEEAQEIGFDSDRTREIAQKLRLLNLTVAAPAPTEGSAERRREQGKAKAGSRKWLIGAIILAQAGALGWLLYDRAGIAANAPASASQTATQERQTTAATSANAASPAGVEFEAQGFTVATRRATVSARVAGIVTAVNIDVGDRVAKGQILGRLDSSYAQHDLRLAEQRRQSVGAQIRIAQASLAQSSGALQRTQTLFDRGFSTRADLERVAADYRVATAQLDNQRSEQASAGIQINQLRGVVGNYTIRAPFAGIVIEKNAQQGELLAPTGAGGGFTRTGFATIIDMNSLEIVVDVGEQFVSRVGSGQPVDVGFYAIPDLTIRGRVSQVMPSADRAKGTVQVRIKLETSDPRVLPDMGTKVMFLRCRDKECPK